MLYRPLGSTGLTVSILGVGAMQLGAARIDEGQAAGLLHAALDAGVTLIDTARSYGESETRIGRHLAARRSEYVLSTKVGYGVEGVPDWTYECVVRGVEAACRRLRTDWIDIVHLHSCERATLERGDVVRALEDSRAAGKLRVAAYSGDNDALEWALSSGRFGVVQTSVNVCDQQALGQLARCGAIRPGVLAKRPLAGRPWQYGDSAADAAAADYRRRFERLFGQDARDNWDALAIRFAAFAPSVAAVLVGTTRTESLASNLRALRNGPLDPEVFRQITERFISAGAEYPGIV